MGDGYRMGVEDSTPHESAQGRNDDMGDFMICNRSSSGNLGSLFAEAMRSSAKTSEQGKDKTNSGNKEHASTLVHDQARPVSPLKVTYA